MPVQALLVLVPMQSDSRVLRINGLTVRRDRVCAEVSVSARAHMTTLQLAAYIVREFPLIGRHACVNEKGSTFGLVIDNTPLPHLLEHLVIDLQMRSAKSDDFVYVGLSEWADEAAGLARVEVNFVDDLVALQAFRDAADFLNNAYKYVLTV